MSDENSLSEDDAVFSYGDDSEGERLDYSEDSGDESTEESEAVATEDEEEESEGKEEEEELEEEENEEESNGKDRGKSSSHKNGKNSRSKRKKTVKPRNETEQKPKRSRFIDTEAAVSDEEDNEDHGVAENSEEEDDEGFVDNEIEEKDKEFTAAFKKRLEAHAAKREAARKAFEQEMDPEVVEERLKSLYGRTTYRSEKDPTVSDAALATMLLPQSTDPKLWLVKCRPGRERSAVESLLHGLNILNDNLGIFSAISRDSLKGYIYIEAHKVTEVMNAVQKTRMNHIIFASPINKPIMVPLAEMSDVLSTTSATNASMKSAIDISNVKIGGWVRVKRGKYSGDLAQVMEIDEDVSREAVDYIIRVKLLPRLSFRGTSKERPIARPFDPQEAAQYASVTKARGYWIYNGEAYKDGFLFKDVRASSLFLADVDPRPDELESFGSLSIKDSEDVEAVRGSALQVPTKFFKGEAVIVTRGEFQHLTGVIESVQGENVNVRFDDVAAFNEPVVILAKYLARRIQVGDMVKIIYGEWKGKAGMVVSLDEAHQPNFAKKSATVFCTVENQQYTVPLNCLVSAAVSADAEIHRDGSPGGGGGKFVKKIGDNMANSLELNDLVTIENDEVGIGLVLRLASEDKHAVILDVNGQERKVLLERLKKIPIPKLTGPARFDSKVFKSGDRVIFSDNLGSNNANMEGRPGTVIQTNRSVAFLKTIDTGDIIVRPTASLSRPTAFGTFAASSKPSNSPRGFTLRNMVGKSVTISGAGPYKGYVGIVKEVNDTTARVELHTNSKVVTVGKERIVNIEDRAALMGSNPPSRTDARAAAAIGGGRASYGVAEGSKTPAWGTDGSRTPAWGMDGSKTPTWGAPSTRTPAWGASSTRTPAWGASSTRTPAWGASSTRTPAWGASSARTPAWGASSAKTPAWESSSAKTPSWNQGKTPTWGTASAPSAPRSSGVPTWLIPEAEITIKSSAKTSKVVSVLPSGLVQVSGESEALPASDLMPVAPVKKDAVRLIGEDNTLGTVIGLDGPDAVIRVDGTADFRIVPISSLVKIVRN